MYKNSFHSLLLTIFLLVGSGCSSAAKESDTYNLNFKEKSPFRWTASALQAFAWDTTQAISGRNAFLFRLSPKFIGKGLEWSTATLSQRIFLPRITDDTITITIRNRCAYIKKAMFYANRYDAQMNLLREDSLDILAGNDEGWQIHKIKLTPQHAQVLDISFLVTLLSGSVLADVYQQPGFMQYMALDSMEITVGDEEIATIGVPTAEEISAPVRLKAERMVPLAVEASGAMLPLKNKKIVGLGETVHFNDEVWRVGLEVIKERIVQANCRLVMLELPYNMGFLLNYYASGAEVPPVFTEVLKKTGLVLFSPSQYAFFEWLRAYNRHRERKVLLLGIDGAGDPFFRPELEVLNAAAKTAADRQSLAGLLDDIANSRYKKVTEDMDQYTPVLDKILGAETAGLLRDIEQDNARWLDREYTLRDMDGERDYYLLKRDELQYQMAKKYLTAFLNADETACIYAHYGHLAKAPVATFFLPLGYYLNREYGDAYSSLAILVGGGTNTVRTIDGFSVRNVEVESPPPNSLEQAAGDLSSSCFYYPFDSTHYSFAFIRRLGSAPFKQQLDQIRQFNCLISPKGHSDGFIYIPEGRPMLASDTVDFVKLRREANDFIYRRRFDFLKGYKK